MVNYWIKVTYNMIKFYTELKKKTENARDNQQKSVDILRPLLYTDSDTLV